MDTKKNLTHQELIRDLFPVIDAIFDQQELIDYQRKIWDLTIAYASQPDDVQLNRIDRSNMIFFCAKLNDLLYALHATWSSVKVNFDCNSRN